MLRDGRVQCSPQDGWTEDNQLDMLKSCPGLNDPVKCQQDGPMYAGRRIQSLQHPGLYDFNENIWYEGTTTPVKEYIEQAYPDQFKSIDWSMNQQACYYEIKKQTNFNCADSEVMMLNLKIVSHGKNIILYGKSGTAWDNADTWVTNPIRITGSPKDFTGTFSFKITEQ